jgi:hypothetical protein
MENLNKFNLFNFKQVNSLFEVGANLQLNNEEKSYIQFAEVFNNLIILF